MKALFSVITFLCLLLLTGCANKNIGQLDRIIRAVIGLGLFWWAFATSWNPLLFFFSGFAVRWIVRAPGEKGFHFLESTTARELILLVLLVKILAAVEETAG